MCPRRNILKTYRTVPKAARLVLFFFFVISILQAHTQQMGFRILSQRKSWTFSFENYNNLIIIPVTLNRVIPLKFILDTGVRTTILTDKTLSDLINVSYDKVITISGAGIKKEITAYLATNVILTLPGIEGTGQSMVVLEEDYLELQHHLGTGVHGILGYEFFNQFIVQVDYLNKQITVYQHGHFKPGSRFTHLPFEIIQARPYVRATLTQPDGSLFEAKLLIDSGASHSLLIETNSDERIILPENRYETIIGYGLGGELHGFLGRLPQMQLAGFQFRNLLVSYVGEYSDPEITAAIQRNGSIGGELLSRFTTIYDYDNQVLYLKNNKNLLVPFEYNMSGLQVIATGIDFKTFEVIHVTRNSPAYKAGISEGDRILKVNGLLAEDITLSELNWLLRSKPGKKVILLLDRNGSRIKKQFELKRMI